MYAKSFHFCFRKSWGLNKKLNLIGSLMQCVDIDKYLRNAIKICLFIKQNYNFRTSDRNEVSVSIQWFFIFSYFTVGNRKKNDGNFLSEISRNFFVTSLVLLMIALDEQFQSIKLTVYRNNIQFQILRHISPILNFFFPPFNWTILILYMDTRLRFRNSNIMDN